MSERCDAEEVVVKKQYEVPSHVITVHGKVLAGASRPGPVQSEGVAEGIFGPLQAMCCNESPPGGLRGGQEVASVEGLDWVIHAAGSLAPVGWKPGQPPNLAK